MICEKCKAEVEDKIMRAMRAMLDEARAEDEAHPPTEAEFEVNGSTTPNTDHARSHGFHYYLLLDWLTKDKKPYFVDPVAEVSGPLFSNLTPATPCAANADAGDVARKD